MPVIPTLPSFVSKKYARTATRDSHLDCPNNWRSGRCHQDNIWQRRAAITAKTNASRRALSQLAVGAFIAIAFAMSSVALHREASLQRMEQQAGGMR
jgi:hypothetical protein